MNYFIRTPWLLQRIYSTYVWEVKTKENVLYLTFDDGPHPVATPFVLDTLAKYNAKASFFCIGKNVLANHDLYKRILDEGHVVGNHTQQHLNGWKTRDRTYLEDVAEAAKYIDSNLFRPPYGRIRSFQAKNIPQVLRYPDGKIIMWTVLSGDFDPAITKEQCLHNVALNARKGSIVVFHDSEKAFLKLEYALPATLQFFADRGYRFEALREISLNREEKLVTKE